MLSYTRHLKFYNILRAVKQVYSHSDIQKQPLWGVLRKRCSEDIQQIYRRTPMPKYDFNKVALQLYWNHTSVWVFSCKCAAYFLNTFYQEHLWKAASGYTLSSSMYSKHLSSDHILIVNFFIYLIELSKFIWHGSFNLTWFVYLHGT